jgi:hypothetical protein
MRVSVKVWLLGATCVVVVQTALWAGVGRHRLRAAAFFRDLSWSEATLAAGTPVSSGDTHQFSVLCDDLAGELRHAEKDDAEERLASMFERIGARRTRLVTEAEWVESQSLLPDPEPSEVGRSIAPWWCSTPRINTPLLGVVDCYDGSGEMAWHGHSHVFFHAFGGWFRVWDGGMWES